MRRFLLPVTAALLSLLVVSQFVEAEDAPRAPRYVRRAARQAEREARAGALAARGLSDGLTSAGRHAPPTPRVAAQGPASNESDIIVVTSHQILPAPCRPVQLREGVFPASSQPEPVAVSGSLVQNADFLPPLPPRDAADRSPSQPPAGAKPVVTSGAPASRPIFANEGATGDVISGVVVAGELAGMVLPEPARLDPSVLQANFNQLPVAVSGAIAFAEEAPPPLPPIEKASTSDPVELSFVQCPSINGPSQEEARIQAALNQSVAMHFEKAQLSEVFHFIANSQGINVVIDDIALAEEGFTVRERVSINVDDVMLKSALDLVLLPLNLEYLIENEVLTSRQHREKELIAQVYSVADLIRPASGIGSPPADSGDAAPSAASDFENVIDLIRSTIQPESWNESGGRAAIAPHTGTRSLVIRQTRWAHQEIAQLLGGIRRVMKDVQPADTTDQSTVLKNGIRSVFWETDELQVQTDQEEYAAAAAILPTSAVLPAENQHSQAESVRQPIERKLARSASLHFNDIPLEKALRDIALTYGIDVVVDEAGLAAEGVTSANLVSLNVDGILLRSALNLLLKPINLDCSVEDQVLKITSRRRDDELTVRVYPVADLATPVRWPEFEAKSPESVSAASCDSLAELIRNTVSPSDWSEFGGRGRIESHDATLSLVVLQSDRAHREIADLLDQLRKLREVEIALEINVVRVSSHDYLSVKSAWGADWYGNRAEASPEQLDRVMSLLAGVEKMTIVESRKVRMYEGQTWRIAAEGRPDTPYAFLTAIASRDRRCVDCNFAVPRTVDGERKLQRVTVFTMAAGNTCIINASEPSPVIENYPFSTGGLSAFGAIRELAPGEGDGVVWDESPDSVTLVFITPRIIVSKEEEEPLAPSVSRSDHAGQPRPMITVTPGRLDPSIMQESLNQLPQAVSGTITLGEEAPPPLPPIEKASTPDPAAHLGDKFRNGREEARIQAALNQPVSLHFREARLSEVFRHVANSQGINIVVDDTGLAEEGATTHDPVTINVDGVMLKSALGLILNSRNLAYLVEDEVLKITSRQRSEGELIAQVYSVSDLVRAASRIGSLPSEGRESVPVGAAASDFENIVELIRSTIQPESWNELGGPAAIVPHPASRSLVIRQTRRGHREIASLLDGIRWVMQDVQSACEIEQESIHQDAIRIQFSPGIIIQEEEENLLGLPPAPLPEEAHSDQSSLPPPPPGVLPDSFDPLGIPTQDLLFRDEEPEPRLILQTP